MKISKHKYLIFTLLTAALLFSQPSAEGSRSVNEEKLKAAFIFRFAQYTTWPEPLGDELRLCLFGDSKVSEIVEGYGGRTIHGSVLTTVRPTSSSIHGQGCDVAFISSQNRYELRDILSSRGDQPVLLISDVPGAFEEKTDIALSTEPNKVTFSINLTEAESKMFTFSGQMLKLAQKVR